MRSSGEGGKEVTRGVGLLTLSLASHPAEKCPWSSCSSAGFQQGGSWGQGRSLPGGLGALQLTNIMPGSKLGPEAMVSCPSPGKNSHPRGSLCPAPCQRQKTEQVMDPPALLVFGIPELSLMNNPCRSAQCHPLSASWGNDSPLSPASLGAPGSSSHSSQLILSSAVPPKPRAFPGADL